MSEAPSRSEMLWRGDTHLAHTDEVVSALLVRASELSEGQFNGDRTDMVLSMASYLRTNASTDQIAMVAAAAVTRLLRAQGAVR